MKFYKKPFIHYLNHKLDKELDKPEEQHAYHKIQLLLALIAYLDEPRITMSEYLERSTPFIRKMQELQKDEEE